MRYWIFFILSSFGYAQNLVPNPSFEDYDICSDNGLVCRSIQLTPTTTCTSSCCGFGLPGGSLLGRYGATHHWSTAGPVTPHYFNSCSIIEWKNSYSHIDNSDNWYAPRTGSAFILLNTYGFRGNTGNFRQYAQVKLTEPLVTDCLYEVSFYALFSPRFNKLIHTNLKQSPSDGLGVFLSPDSLVIYHELNYPEAFTSVTPQIQNPSGQLMTDSVHYQKVSGIYKAQGGEQWLVLGNFKDNAHTQTIGDTLTVDKSMYAIDDVSVELWRPKPQRLALNICIDSLATFSLPEGFTHYSWSTGDTTRSITTIDHGTFTGEASNSCTVFKDTFNVHKRIRYTDPFSIGEDSFFCDFPTALNLSAPDVYFPSYHWSTGATTKHIAITQPGKYWLTIVYECGTLSDTIRLTEFQQPDTLLLPISDTTICSNEVLTLQVHQPSLYASYLWNDGSNLSSLSISQPGTYTLQARTFKDCLVKDTIKLSLLYPPVPPAFTDAITCQGIPYTLVVDPANGEHIQWYDGITTREHHFSTGGDYWVTLSNRCYASSDTVHLDFLDCTLTIPNLITANEDGLNDYLTIQTPVTRPIQLTVYNSWGTEIFKEENYSNQWGGADVKKGIYFYYAYDALLDKKYKGWIQLVK